jgi:hypothetical protein
MTVSPIMTMRLLRETCRAGDALEARRQLVGFYDYCMPATCPSSNGSLAPSPAGRLRSGRTYRAPSGTINMSDA